MTAQPRLSGVLAHPTSFPSPYGIGDLGKGAYDFIDFLRDSGQNLWQVLPLGPTGFGDSPYQCFSAFAGQPLLISPDDLLHLHLITEADLLDHPAFDPTHTDYGAVLKFKKTLFAKAFSSFRRTPDRSLLSSFDAFCEKNQTWLNDYAVYMSCKDAHEGRCWIDWGDEMTDPTLQERRAFEEKHASRILSYKFQQFLFFREWDALKQYANDAGVQIVGDIPFFPSYDSADVWANKSLFLLDRDGRPTFVSGVPPDYFSSTGQLWGNPLYNWPEHKAAGYAWWISRIRMQTKLTDYLRIDHFRGFESFWAVPAGEETAINGSWRKGPGAELFLAVRRELGNDLPIWAEDLGFITPEVRQLRDRFRFPGMKILQFAFDGLGESEYHPHNLTDPNCICYTGTHDNDTTTGWYQKLGAAQQDKVCRYCSGDGSTVSRDLIRVCLASIARYAVFPIQDLFGQGSDARMNLPGSAFGNWAYRFEADDLTAERADWLKKTSLLFGRGRSLT